jgi:hypothetical protein
MSRRNLVYVGTNITSANGSSRQNLSRASAEASYKGVGYDQPSFYQDKEDV